MVVVVVTAVLAGRVDQIVGLEGDSMVAGGSDKVVEEEEGSNCKAVAAAPSPPVTEVAAPEVALEVAVMMTQTSQVPWSLTTHSSTQMPSS